MLIIIYVMLNTHIRRTTINKHEPVNAQFITDILGILLLIHYPQHHLKKS